MGASSLFCFPCLSSAETRQSLWLDLGKFLSWFISYSALKRPVLSSVTTRCSCSCLWLPSPTFSSTRQSDQWRHLPRQLQKLIRNSECYGIYVSVFILCDLGKFILSILFNNLTFSLCPIVQIIINNIIYMGDLIFKAISLLSNKKCCVLSS